MKAINRPRAKAIATATSVTRCRWDGDLYREPGALEAAPYAIIMLLLRALSLASAIKDPLAFGAIFAWM